MKHTAKIIILAITILFTLITITTAVSASTYWIDIGGDYIEADGYVTSTTKHESANITVASSKRGYVEWNITQIPVAATILGATLKYYLCNAGGDGSYDIYIMATSSDIRANTSTGTQIWSASKVTLDSAYRGHGYNLPPFVASYVTINGSLGGWDVASPVPYIQDALSRGWFSLYTGYSGSIGSGHYDIASRDYPGGYTPPILSVEYEVTAPQVSNEVPLDYSTGVNLTPTLCINVTHDLGNTMDIDWYWYNTSNASYDQFDTNNTVGNGTYCQLADWATEPCTEYTWWVHVEDAYGNFTNAVYTFTTHCINPPSSLACSSPTTDSINISFTKKPANGGTTYTVYRYQHGGFPPSWTGGTFGENTTNSTINATGLDEGQCYAFSFWTVWQSADGNWYKSDDANQIICCASGGNYRICLFDEETEQALDFSTYPYNLSTFVLRTHYYDNTEDDSFLFGDNASSPVAGGLELYDCGGKTCFNTSTVTDVWYFELICFYDFNNSRLYGGLDGRAPYSRKLTPLVALETECCGVTMDTIYFYVANRTVYGANYYYESAGNITQTQDSDYPASVVEYEYYFIDETGNYLSEPINTVFVSIYEPTLEGTKIIHQEYLDASRVNNPFLLYGKDYLMGIYSTSNSISNIGIAPTSMNLQPRITISGGYVEEYVFGTVNISLMRQGDGKWINISYFDSDYATQNVTFKLYTTDDILVSSFIKYASDTYHNFTGLSNSTAYYIVVHVNKSFDISGAPVVFYATSSYFLSALIDYITTADYIDSLIVGTIGDPVIGTSWAFFIVIFLGLITLLGLISFVGASGAFIASGVLVTALNVFISGLNPITAIVGIMLVAFGFIMVLTERRKRGFE